MAIEIGSEVQGTVTNVTHFGAFVEFGDNQTGLVHISEIANHFVKEINDEVKRGDSVSVKILKVEDNGNVALSIKQATPSPETQAAKQEASRPQEPVREERPEPRRRDPEVSRAPRPSYQSKRSNGFDDLMSDFMKNSEERLSSLRRNTESKRGGRGGRRS